MSKDESVPTQDELQASIQQLLNLSTLWYLRSEFGLDNIKVEARPSLGSGDNQFFGRTLARVVDVLREQTKTYRKNEEKEVIAIRLVDAVKDIYADARAGRADPAVQRSRLETTWKEFGLGLEADDLEKLIYKADKEKDDKTRSAGEAAHFAVAEVLGRGRTTLYTLRKELKQDFDPSRYAPLGGQFFPERREVAEYALRAIGYSKSEIDAALWALEPREMADIHGDHKEAEK